MCSQYTDHFGFLLWQVGSPAKECLDATFVTPGLSLTKTSQGRFDEDFHQK